MGIDTGNLVWHKSGRLIRFVTRSRYSDWSVCRFFSCYLLLLFDTLIMEIKARLNCSATTTVYWWNSENCLQSIVGSRIHTIYTYSITLLYTRVVWITVVASFALKNNVIKYTYVYKLLIDLFCFDIKELHISAKLSLYYSKKFLISYVDTICGSTWTVIKRSQFWSR